MKDEPLTRPQVTLEDLLRFKRAERPPVAFWADFDRQMRAKQLAAIVEPRPWWAPLIRIHSRLARYQLPVGATAILALSLVTVQGYRQPESEPVFVPAGNPARLDAMPGPALSLPAEPSSAEMTTETAVVVAKSDPAHVVATDVPARAVDAIPGNDFQLVSMISGQTPSARSIEANLADVKANQPELARYLDRAPGLDNRSSAPRLAAVDPLVHMQSPSDARLARVLSTALPAVATTSTDIGERRYESRLDRDLTDERLYERVSRIDLEGKRLAINFRL